MLIVFLFGLGYLLGIYLIVNQPVRHAPQQMGPVTTKPVSLTLNLSNPDDNLLVFIPDLLVSGKTAPQAVVIISLETVDLALEASSKGDFSTTLKLQDGVNNLTVSVFDNQGNSKTESKLIYYSGEKI